MTRRPPRSFGDPLWYSEELPLTIGAAHGSTDAPPDPPALWLPRRGGYELKELIPPARPLGFVTRPREAA